MSFLYRKWKDRLKMLLYLPFSNHALKYFPPDFTLRDPVTDLVYNSRKKGHACGLILVHWEQLRHMTAMNGLQELHKQIRRSLREIAERHFHHNEIVGITQPSADEFCIYVRDRFAMNFEKLQMKAQWICKELESQYETMKSGKPQLLFGCCLLSSENEVEDARAAIRNAYDYAHALATKKLPKHVHTLNLQLSSILHGENISVLAQPIIRLQDGDIFGWELLTRGPENTPFYMPSDLFEYAYQTNLLSKLEMVVMKKAFREIQKRNIEEQVFLNITAVSLTHPLFLNQLLELMAEFPEIQPQQIIFEITERHYVRDYQHLGQILRTYRNYGFRFAVDDAGAGYSSLQSISELVPDIIKIDRSLIQNIDQVSVKQTMLKGLMSLAEHINCQVIAEGIEREEEAHILSEYAVQMGQGYFFARPQPLLIRAQHNEYEKFKEKVKFQLKLSSA